MVWFCSAPPRVDVSIQLDDILCLLFLVVSFSLTFCGLITLLYFSCIYLVSVHLLLIELAALLLFQFLKNKQENRAQEYNRVKEETPLHYS